jgi:phosphoglucosamine mutase
MEGMQKLPQVMINVKVGQPEQVVTCVVMQKAISKQTDKLADKGRILVRASGTEPLLRVMVEGEDAEQVREIANELALVAESQG